MAQPNEIAAFEVPSKHEELTLRAIASFDLYPHDDASVILHERDQALWAIVARLSPGDVLELRYRLQVAEAGGSKIGVALLSPHHGRGGFESVESVSKESRDALLLAFPGFLATGSSSYRPAAGREIPAPAIALPVGASGAHRRLGPQIAGAIPEEFLYLPLRGGLRFNLDAGLSAIARVDTEGEVLLRARKFKVDATILRFAQRARSAHHANGEGPFVSLMDMVSRAQAQEEIDLWLDAAFGLEVAVSVLGPLADNDLLCETLGRLFWGEGPGANPRDGLDLAGCFPSGSSKLPRLTPRPETLSSLGFRDVNTVAEVDMHDALVLGKDFAGREVAISRPDCGLHTYLIGATGVGKSTLLSNMIRQDIAAKRAVILIDPHGDLFAETRAALSFVDRFDAVIADTSDFARPFGLNVLEIQGGPEALQRNFVANHLIGVFKSVLYRNVPEAFGPMFEAYFRNALLLLMDAGGPEATLADFDRIFGEDAYRRDLLQRCSDPTVVRFWRQTAARAGGEVSLENIAPYICSKLTQLTGNALLRPIVTATKTTLDFSRVMSERRVCLINLAKGQVGDVDSALLGGLIMIRLFGVAMARASLPAAKRNPVRVYLDEFPTYAGSVLAQMLAECRKFGIELVLANQGLGQVDASMQGSAHSILSNVANVLAFRTGPDDARRLADWFGPEIDPLTLTRLPNHVLAARLLAAGTPRPPIRIRTEAPASIARGG